MVTDMICCDCGTAFMLERKGPVVRAIEIVLSFAFGGLLGSLGFFGIRTLVSGPQAREDPITWVFASFSVLALICLYWLYTAIRGAFRTYHCRDCNSANIAPTHSSQGRSAMDRFNPHPPVLGTKGARAHFHETTER